MRALLLLLTVVLICSCNRTEIHHKIGFKGSAVDYYTHYPVKNATIEIFEEYEHPNGRRESARTGGGNTDEEGTFDFKAKDVHKDKYVLSRYLLFTGPGVNASYYSGQFQIGDVERTNEYDVKLNTLSRIQLSVINSAPYNANDEIRSIYIERPWGNQQVGQGYEVFTGTVVNEEMWTNFYGYTMSVVHYTVTKNSVTQQYTDTIFTPDPFSTVWVQDTIFY